MNLSTTTCEDFTVNISGLTRQVNTHTYLKRIQLMRLDIGEREPGLLDKSRFIEFKGVAPLLTILECNLVSVPIGWSIKVPLDLIQKVEPGSVWVDFRSKP